MPDITKITLIVILILTLISLSSCKTPEEYINEGDLFVAKADAVDIGAPSGLMGGEKEQLLKKAVNCYNKAIESDPNCIEAWYEKGNTLLLMKKPDEAISCFDKALKIDKKHGKSWYKKGNALYRLKKYDEAITCFDKALEIFPKDRDIQSSKDLTLDALKIQK